MLIQQLCDMRDSTNEMIDSAWIYQSKRSRKKRKKIHKSLTITETGFANIYIYIYIKKKYCLVFVYL